MNKKQKRIGYISLLSFAILFPFICNINLFLFGTYETAKAVYVKRVHTKGSHTSPGGTYDFTKFEFQVGNYIYTATSASNVKYKENAEVTIIYDESDPTNNLVLNISSLYLGIRMVLPLFLLFIYTAVASSLGSKKVKPIPKKTAHVYRKRVS